jgi:LmbE family N-acetylglucosaminyl deacetylase
MRLVKEMKVLAVGAHPDDIELGAGASISKHEKTGDLVHFLILSFGEKSGNKTDRKIEAWKSAQILKVKSLTFGHLPDTMISSGIETITVIENLINKIKPDRIYTQSPKDRHQDHRNTAYATFSAARRMKEVLCYESPDSYPDFVPQYFVKLNAKALSQKIEALHQYGSQKGKAFLEKKAIRGLASFRGYQIGVLYAEAFEVARIIDV